MKISRKLLTITECIDYIELTTDAALYRIYAMNDDMFRIRCSFDREFAPEASYALVMTAWDDAMDHVIKDRKKITALSLKIEEHEHDYRCTTKNLVLKIVKEPFAIIFEDHEGVVLHQDVGSRSYVQDDLNRIYHYSVSSDEDYYYGFGEKSGLLNKRNRRLRMQNVDTLGYNSESTDPLYKHIPFYIKFNGKNQSASGMFYHNTHQSTFDVGMERSGYWPKYTYYSADGGELDYFFIHGPMIKQVVQRYTDLTGKSILTPKFSLGYLGSTMFYTELEAHSDRAILGFLEQCEEQGIPCDGFLCHQVIQRGRTVNAMFSIGTKTVFLILHSLLNSRQVKALRFLPILSQACLLHIHCMRNFLSSAYLLRMSMLKLQSLTVIGEEPPHLLIFLNLLHENDGSRI